MSTPLPPDPYVALGLGKDATPAQIKTTYRKLVLKCHPDKVTDESKKAEASDQFHRIQQAYEILSDEGRRSRYDAHIKMAELRKQNMSNRPPVEVRTAAYEVPTSGPGRATFTARGPERVYEERRPERSDSDDYFGNTSRTTSRKHDDYDRQAPKKTTVPLRDDKERARVVERERRDSERVSRTDKRRTRDQDVKRERDRKYEYDDESDADLRQDAERRRRAAEEASREKEMRERERARVDRERERERDVRESSGRDRDDYDRERSSRRGYDAQHYSRLEDDTQHVLAYIGRDKRPSLPRSTSTATKTETYVDRSGRPTPAFVRRHSAKPAASPQSRRDRDRRPSVPDDILETDERRPSTRPTTLYPSVSSPSAIKVPREPPLRASSMKMDDRNVPPLPIRRSETMPNISPKRAKDSKPSNLRDTLLSDGYPTPAASPDYPSPTTSTKYHYSRPEPLSSRDDVDYRRTVDRDYDRGGDRNRERRMNHSPEPMRESMRSSKSSATPRYTAPQPPPIITNQGYSRGYTTESPTSYSARPSPVRRETQRSEYDSLPKAGVPKANSSAKYEHSFDSGRDYDKDRRKASPIDEYGGYSSYRAPSSATRPHLRRQHTSDYASYAPPRTTVA
jgi:curved DNA-binding protein CbpA